MCSPHVHASPVVNGDFETGDLSGWVNTATATIDSATPLAGSHSVVLPNDVGPGAPQTLTQAFTAQTGPTTVSFTYSMANPGTGLGLHVYLGETASGQVNLVIWDIGNDGDGDVSIFDKNTNTFQTILTDAVVFGATETFSLTFNDYDAGFDYDLTVGSQSASGLSFSQFEGMDDFNELTFVNEFGNTSYEIDNVVVSAVPEPASAVLLILSVLGLVGHRRRNA